MYKETLLSGSLIHNILWFSKKFSLCAYDYLQTYYPFYIVYGNIHSTKLLLTKLNGLSCN